MAGLTHNDIVSTFVNLVLARTCTLVRWSVILSSGRSGPQSGFCAFCFWDSGKSSSSMHVRL